MLVFQTVTYRRPALTVVRRSKNAIPPGTGKEICAAHCNRIGIRIRQAGSLEGGYGGGVFRSTNNGANWTQVDNGLTDTAIDALAVIGANLFAGTQYGGGVYVSTNNGTLWTSTNTGPSEYSFVGALAVNGENLFAAAEHFIAGKFYHDIFQSPDNGISWSISNDGMPEDLVTGIVLNGTNLFAGTQNNGVFRSTNNGLSWTSESTGMTNVSVNTLVISGSNLFAGTYGGGVFLSTNNGTIWTKASNGFSSADTIINSFTLSGTNIFAGTSDSNVYLSTNNGTTWTNIGIFTSNVLALYTLGTSLFVGTDSGVYVTTNNGTSWAATSNGMPNTKVFAFSSNGANLFAGTNSGVYLSSDNGTNWTQVNTGLPAVTGVDAFAVSGNNLFAGTNYGVWRRPLSDFGISDVKNPLQPDLNLSLSPNPTSGIITMHNVPVNIVHVTITDIFGESIVDLLHPNAPEFTVDLSKLPQGTYFARFSSPIEVITRKIIKE